MNNRHDRIRTTTRPFYLFLVKEEEEEEESLGKQNQ
jgi:hypothetical protein